MQLQYYYLVFNQRSPSCPTELWEKILGSLCVVFSVYGHKFDPLEHEMFVICEDDHKMSLFDRLADEYKYKIKDEMSFMIHNSDECQIFGNLIIPILLRARDVTYTDNRKNIFGDKDKK